MGQALKPFISEVSPLLDGRPETLTAHDRVLIVEDELGLQTMLNHVLTSLDPHLRLVWAGSFREAVDEIRQGNLSLIIADYQLNDSGTGLDLWAFCRRVYPDVPFMLMSAMGVDRYLNLVSSIQSPPPFLSKPFRVLECQQTIAGLLYARHPQDGEQMIRRLSS